MKHKYPLFIFLLFFTLVSPPSILGQESTCGDDICSLNEDESVCPEDCGVFDINIPLSDVKVVRGQPVTVPIHINHRDRTPEKPTFDASEDLLPYADFPDSPQQQTGSGIQTFRAEFLVPETALIEDINGIVTVNAHGKSVETPLNLEIIENSDSAGSLKITNLVDEVQSGEDIVYTIRLDSQLPSITGDITVYIRNVLTQEQIQIDTFTPESRNINEVRRIELNNTLTQQLQNTTGSIDGTYDLLATFNGPNEPLRSLSILTIETPFYATTWFRTTLIIIVSTPIIFGIAVAVKKYIAYRQSKKRYVPPKLSKLPGADKQERILNVGRVGGTNKTAYMDPDDFTTHALVAGSTGSGKSVTASVIVEEALENDVPVVAFDPTTQWTGFLAACKDENVLQAYDKFNISRDKAKSYKGLIYTPTDKDFEVDFDKCLNPGEITVFNLADLTLEDYDYVVGHIIDELFERGWEESPDLRLVVVFDEVHRLLDERCSGAGYQGLIRAAREFRKWGIGLIMASQVSSDFKEEIGGNVLTEVQLNTKNMGDIEKVSSKYGEEFAQRVTRQGVGVGLVQNPRYNDGKPWFVEFRPPYHDPHKLSDEALQAYDEYTTRINTIKQKIQDKKEAGNDVEDIALDLNLAEGKLKEGKFKMVDIYLGDLEEQLNIS